MQKYGIIYLIRNKINGKCYIGQTTRQLKIRFGQHIQNSKISSNLPLYRAFNKYNYKNFEIFHIDTCYTNQNDLNGMECHYIELFNSKVEDEGGWGYNLRDGGANGKLANSTKQKLSLVNKGKKLSEEHKRKIAKGGLGRTPTFETKQRLSNSKNKFKKQVLCIETGEIFSSISECAKKHDMTKSHLSKYLQRKYHYKSQRGFTFSFFNT